MESRKLTKADLDKVREIEGFPIADDEDIIALSDAPFYTACPNPFIQEFIAENGTPYDEATDDYHRERLLLMLVKANMIQYIRCILIIQKSLIRPL